MQVTKDIIHIGVSDRELELFESQYRVPGGMSYNSYIILDEKVAVMDSVERDHGEEWLGLMEKALGGRKPDYLIVQHMEPDHSANIALFSEKYPDAAIVANAKTFTMIDNFFRGGVRSPRVEVKNGETLSLGRHELKFIFAPMVHWPEVMLTYDACDKVLFSADAFGRFGTFDDGRDWADEARRYYIGIVGKYGPQVVNVLKAASQLEISAICPLHGPVLSDNLAYYIDKYNKWASYTPELEGVLIAYTSVYGHTAEAALYLAGKLEAMGVKAETRDLARCDMSEAVGLAFAYGKVVFATTTYNGDIFPPMRVFIENLTERNFQNRTAAFIENGSWAPMAAKVMAGMLEKCKNMNYLEQSVKIMSSLSEDNRAELDAMAESLKRS